MSDRLSISPRRRRRIKAFRKYGVRNFVSYALARLRCRLKFLEVYRLLLPRLRRRRFEHIIPLGSTCETAYRFFDTWGFLESSLLAWAGTYTLDILLAVLSDLSALMSAGASLEDYRFIWHCRRTGVDFHGKLHRVGGRMPSEAEKRRDYDDLCGRIAHLREKFLRYLRDDQPTLFVRRLGVGETDEVRLARNLDALEATLDRLGARNWTLLVVCLKKDLPKMPAGPRRVFRAVRAFNPPFYVTESELGDPIGWRAVFTEFAPARLLPKTHAFSFE